jgi:transcriptional regulator of aromatic amino acid metabolism
MIKQASQKYNSKQVEEKIRKFWEENSIFQKSIDQRKKFNISKEELERLVWEKSTTEIARELGVSDVAIAKRCKKLGIEKPGRGYWAKQRIITRQV